jgi:RNA polymerase sigma-70 factor (ECF subfamily)
LQAHDWQTVVEGYGPLVWQTAYRLLGNPADVADCFQETFLTALEVSRRQHVRNLPGLLIRLATTRAIDRLRQRIRRDRHESGAYDSDRSAEGADPLEQIETQDLAEHLREAIGRLPSQEANVFCLRYLNDMSYVQIARELKIRVNAVGVSLHRAKARLRELLTATDVKDEVSHEPR